jgi:hypothetical protein
MWHVIGQTKLICTRLVISYNIMPSIVCFCLKSMSLSFFCKISHTCKRENLLRDLISNEKTLSYFEICMK